MNYKKLSPKKLLEIVNHELDHDCRCSDPEGACMSCFEAWQELEKRKIYHRHHE